MARNKTRAFADVEGLNDITQSMLTEASNNNARADSSHAKEKPITVLVACFNGAGEADIAVVSPIVSEEETDNGEQYEKAKAMAKEEGYLPPYVPFDMSERGNIIAGLRKSMYIEKQWPWRITAQ